MRRTSTLITVRAARIVYLEGYLWDPPEAGASLPQGHDDRPRGGQQGRLTLSDPFCVDRYRDEFLALMRDGSIDVLFANIHELKSLYQTAAESAALAALREEGVLGVVTRSAEGALVVTRRETRAIPAAPIERLVDTTGAGDCSRPASSQGWISASTTATARASAASPPLRSSSISARGHRRACGIWRVRRDC